MPCDYSQSETAMSLKPFITTGRVTRNTTRTVVHEAKQG